jgi:hypothetical protein
LNFGSFAAIRSSGRIPPETNAEVQDRMNERMGKQSRNKGLDVIQKVNDRNTRYKDFAADHKHVNVRTRR